MSTDQALREQLSLAFTLNGRPVRAEVAPNELLLDVLRDRMGLRGAKRSCDVQVCGSCTVLVNGLPVSACSTLAYEVRGATVLTIEGLSGQSGLHPLQQAFLDRLGLQCGFCTSGMVLAAKSLLDENPRPTREQIVAYLQGNLCRCTGYWNIIEAVEHAAETMAGAAEAEARNQ